MVATAKDQIVAFDFFSGCGGTSRGLSDAGVRIAGAVDNDPDAAETYRKNFPETTLFEQDVATLTVNEVRQLIPVNQPTLLAGCAPCQPFSAQQKHSDVTGSS